MQTYHLVSWNVNGIRAIIKKDFISDIKALNPDFLCLQETKAQPEDVQASLSMLSDFPHVYYNSSKARKGYSGTAILSKTKPISVVYDLGHEEHDQEGRVIAAEFDHFVLLTVYTPNSGEGLKRLDYRENWDKTFCQYCADLQTKKPLVICGDLNVAHHEIDIARPKENYNKSSGYTQKEIDGFNQLLSSGFLDTFRSLHPTEIKYSWWNYKFSARERNVGWRIDYFLTSQNLKPHIKEAEIYNQYFGSDHCPVGLTLEI